MKKLAIFASGSGTNAENIIKHFENNKDVMISGIYSNNPNAYVLERAKKYGIDSFVFSREEFYKNETILNLLEKQGTDIIILAGFLWLIPEYLINKFEDSIINIHPALLPSYGGKGMYGENVHKAVIANGEKQSGITIHFVNKEYDDGKIIFQTSCEISEEDSPETLASKIHDLEYKFFPGIIEKVIFNRD